MQHLLRRYEKDGPVQTVALGDSPNDESMLANADIAVIIESAHAQVMQPAGPQQVIRTIARGPRGWQEAMDTLLATPELFPMRN